MKTLFVHARSNKEVKIPDSVIQKLPKKVGVVASIQLAHKIPDIVKQIPNSLAGGQVLGCNASMASKLSSKVDAFLFVGSGVFHPIQIALQTKKPVYTYNPFNDVFKKLEQKEIDTYEKAHKGAVLKFLNAKSVGVIVSTKIGQANLKRALQMKKDKSKEYYIFVCDTLDFRWMEDFNFIDCWVNTACPRLDDQRSGIVSINDLIAAKAVKFPHIPEGYEVPIWMGTKGLSLK